MEVAQEDGSSRRSYHAFDGEQRDLLREGRVRSVCKMLNKHNLYMLIRAT